MTYDVAGGTLTELLLDGGVTGAACLVSSLGAAEWTDTRSAPPPGAGYYYLPRANGVCGAGSWGQDGSGIERVLTAACP